VIIVYFTLYKANLFFVARHSLLWIESTVFLFIPMRLLSQYHNK
jgi:hypothetical protein